MLRRTQSVALKDDTDTDDLPRQEARPSLLRNDARQRLEKLRGEYERPAAAPAAASAPADSDATPVEHPVLPQRPSVPDRARNGGLDALRTEYHRSLLTPAEEERTNPLAGIFGMLRPSRVILLVVALLAGGVAAYLAVSRPADPVPAAAAAPAPVEIREVKAPTAQVLVARSAIGIGQALTPDNLQWQEWPETAVRTEFITQASQPDALTSMNTSLARSAFYAGEPIRAEKLAPVGEGLLASILEPGMRGVAVSVTADSAAGGFVAPGDHVDVLMSRTTPLGTDSQTILSNVRVLAIDSHVGGPGDAPAPADGDSGDGTTFATAIATLALTPTQAEIIVSAASISKLTLVLRSVSDTGNTDDARAAAANAQIKLTSPFWAAKG